MDVYWDKNPLFDRRERRVSENIGPLGEVAFLPAKYACVRLQAHNSTGLLQPCPECQERPKERTKGMQTLSTLQYAILVVFSRQSHNEIDSGSIREIRNYLISYGYTFHPLGQITVAVAAGRLLERGLLKGGRSDWNNKLMEWTVTEAGLALLDPEPVTQ